MTTLFALFAEVERELVSERTREGLALGPEARRPKGSLGVSRLDGREDEIRRLLELDVSKTVIAKLTGVSPCRALQLHEHHEHLRVHAEDIEQRPQSGRVERRLDAAGLQGLVQCRERVVPRPLA